MQQLIFDYQSIAIIPFTETAIRQDRHLRKQDPRLGKMDLKIAAIALTYNAILLTRNQSDFSQIVELQSEDWSY